jgi:type I restriction enzyme S subunit
MHEEKYKTYTFDNVVLFARTGLNPRDNFKLGQGNNKYITIKNIQNNELIFDKNTDVVDDDAIKLIHKRSQIQKGDILFASIGRIGDMYIIQDEPNGWDINESVFAFTLNTKIIQQKYFYYIFKNQTTLDYLKNNSSGSTFKSIKMNQLKRMTFLLPSLEEQNRISLKLDKCNKIINNYKRIIEKYDMLIKSRFIEMFGNLANNTKKWIIKNFTECAIIDTKMVKDFEKYADYPHIGIDSIEKETGVLSGFRTVKEDNVISGKYLFTPEHIIYSKIRPNLNKVAMPNFEGLCSADAYPILVKKHIATREYLTYVMRSDFFVSYILTFSRRANMPKVNKEQVESFNLPLPPYELQNQFSNFVQQIDKSKFEYNFGEFAA